jgi:PKD repeat protein
MTTHARGMSLRFVLISLIFLLSHLAQAGQVALSWDANPQPEVAGYMVYYGELSGAYTNKVDVGQVTNRTITGLLEGKTYFYAVTCYDAGRVESAFSNETSSTIPSVTPTPAPVASLVADKTTGFAPLTVMFTSTSTGSISAYSWSFGDGTGSTLANPSHAYGNAGSYTVSLTVTGPGGSNTATKTNYVTASKDPTPPPPTPNTIIVDNLVAGTQDATRTFTGKWCNSTGTGSYGTNSLSSCGLGKDTYRWSFSVTTTGAYDLYVQWSTHRNRSTAVPFTVVDSTGLHTKSFNQQVNGGQWVLHGRYSFAAGVSNYVEVSDVNGIANADAVKIVPAGTTIPPGSANGLVAAYGFNEGTGTAVRDSSGNSNNGASSGTTWLPTGRFGKALSFNGSSSLVSVADSNSLDLTNGMTLEAWVYPTVALSSWRSVIAKEQTAGAVYYLEANSDSNVPAFGIYAGGEQTLLGTATLPANAWSHLAASYDGTTQRIYVNGVQVASRAQTGTISTSAGVLRIGGNSVWGEYFQGHIDEVRIYNRALNTSEIQADMGAAIQ